MGPRQALLNGISRERPQPYDHAARRRRPLPKLASGQRPSVIDLMKNKDMALVINTPSGKNPREDEVKIRTAAMQNRIPIMTTLRGADAALRAIKSLQGSEVQVRALQEYHK
ncbi:MAG TPA: hypothetical protein PLB55_21975 [Prosthecobacter sp.]|nr:hypothetical protein [Prosthecobacter sp.]